MVDNVDAAFPSKYTLGYSGPLVTNLPVVLASEKSLCLAVYTVVVWAKMLLGGSASNKHKQKK